MGLREPLFKQIQGIPLLHIVSAAASHKTFNLSLAIGENASERVTAPGRAGLLKATLILCRQTNMSGKAPVVLLTLFHSLPFAEGPIGSV